MKVALVTGGSSGMGEASARELARRGWRVATMSRNASHQEFFSLKGDVAQDADCRRVAQAVLDKWGRIDALVNSAGTTKFVAHADLEGLSAEDCALIVDSADGDGFVGKLGEGSGHRAPRWTGRPRGLGCPVPGM